MSDQAIKGEVPNGVATDGPQPPSQTASEIFQAEITALRAAEEGGAKRASEYGVVKPRTDPEPEAQEPAAQPEQSSGSDETAETEEGQESGESADPSKPERRNWKKEALETKQAFETLKAELAEIKQALRQPQTTTQNQAPAEFTVPELDISKLELTQELKDLLEYTPGLDKLVATLSAQTAKAIIEKAETDRTLKEQAQADARQREETDKKYWANMDGWFKGQYPELSLSEVRTSPDFVDWMKYHQSWVDTQLSSSPWDDISGAQKVFDRYVQDKGLAKNEPDSGKRNLAAARTPAANLRSAPQASDRRSLFLQEAERLNSNKHRFRTTI